MEPEKRPLPVFVFFFVFAFLVLVFSLPVTSFASTLSTSYLLSCGSSSNSTPSPSIDWRTFLPDDHSSFPSLIISFDGSYPVASTRDTNIPSLYSTARVFKRRSSYFFPVNSNGTHVLRLHFYPFPSQQQQQPPFNLSTARFSVSSSGLTLLPDFTPNSNSSNPLVLKEFIVNANDINPISLSFSPLNGSFAFVSAIELFNATLNLDPTITTKVTASSPGDYKGPPWQLLETIHRVNVGGPLVTPNNDSLWRTWVNDSEFLDKNSPGEEVMVSTTDIDYWKSGTSTREIAPDHVYRSLRALNRTNLDKASPLVNSNLTLELQVNSGETYLVRMHFCDVISKTSDQFSVSTYLNDHLAEVGIDLSGIEVATPKYRDYVVDAGDSTTRLRVGVRPYISNLPAANAILNGLEVMRIAEGVLVQENPPKSGMGVGLIIGVAVAGCVAAAVAAIFLLAVVRKSRKKKKEEEKAEMEPRAAQGGGGGPRESAGWSPLLAFTSSSAAVILGRTSGSPAANLHLELKIPLVEIRSATGNFNHGCQVGSGGFGKVYRGLLRDGTEVAVKRASPGSGQGLLEFQNEITVLSRIRHRHLVSLIGYCDEQGEMILVYEFMAMGTLRDHLYSTDDEVNPCLPWKRRLELCIGAAKGLHYLHTGFSQAIIHRDVKSANILLDESYLAKVADFGLSKLGPLVSQTHVSTGVKGSFGYLDPEYYRTQQLTEKSDVYSFGVVLLEVACARPAIDPSLPYDQINLAEWGMGWQRKGRLEMAVDPKIRDEIKLNSLRRFGETVEKCLAPYGVDRPSMGDILWNLDYTLKLQETAVHREPYEDSISGPSAVNIRRLPSTNTEGWPNGNTTTNMNIELGDKQVFSQLFTNEGR